MQDIFKFAMKMEIDGKMYYEKQAAKTDNPKLKEILLTLAEEENRHIEVFRRLSENIDDIGSGDILAGGETLKKVQNIFEKLSSGEEKVPFGGDAISVWTEALRTEEKAEQFYRIKADEDSNKGRKKLLNRIADEEKNHIMMIDSILMFMKDPATFMASTQYMNFKSLEGR
ncbi:MAG: ferritin family protein [Candidatus Zixiibacteriota bacterium]